MMIHCMESSEKRRLLFKQVQDSDSDSLLYVKQEFLTISSSKPAYDNINILSLVSSLCGHPQYLPFIMTTTCMTETRLGLLKHHYYIRRWGCGSPSWPVSNWQHTSRS